MANISSYNQLSSWNEDDDLLFVQQPDAPKKAHPSQMKEYILRGLDVPSVGGAGKYISAISETDGKISATAETMDEAPTEGSTKAVTSGGIKTAIDDSVSLKTATGNPITLTDAANANAEKLLMTIEPIQDLHGYSKPWPAGGGKNLLESVTPTETVGGITYTLNDDGSVTCSGTYSADSYHQVGLVTLPAGTYILSGRPKGNGDFTLRMSTYPDDVWLGTDRGAGATITLSQSTDCVVRIYAYSNAVVGKTFYPMIRLATETDPTFEPYTNICPISGLTSGEVETTDGTDTNTATITLGQTVYGGSVNFKTGEVTVTHGMVDLGTLTYSYNAGNTRFITTISDMKNVNDWIAIDIYCSQYKKQPMAPGWNENNAIGTYSTSVYIRDTRFTDVAAFKTAMSGVQFCYELETPVTLTLTPAELELLKGNNTITANGAEISIEYYPDNAIGALAKRVDDKADITYVDNVVKYTDVTINANTIGHNPPTLSAGGVYYEPLVTYEVLGVDRDKILNVIPVGWNNITKPFNLYLSTSTAGVFTDSDTSIYKDAIAVNTNLTLRVVYKN